MQSAGAETGNRTVRQPAAIGRQQLDASNWTPAIGRLRNQQSDAKVFPCFARFAELSRPTVGQIESKARQRLVKLFREQLGCACPGEWTDGEGNANIEPELLHGCSCAWLRRAFSSRPRGGAVPMAGAAHRPAEYAASGGYSLGDRGRRIGLQGAPDEEGLGGLHSSPVPRGRGGVFRQAMGRRAQGPQRKKTQRAGLRRVARSAATGVNCGRFEISLLILDGPRQ